MRFTVLIPARLASSRLPNKPLADIAGIPMVVRVAQRAAQSGAARVVVAADSPAIMAAPWARNSSLDRSSRARRSSLKTGKRDGRAENVPPVMLTPEIGEEGCFLGNEAAMRPSRSQSKRKM